MKKEVKSIHCWNPAFNEGELRRFNKFQEFLRTLDVTSLCTCRRRRAKGRRSTHGGCRARAIHTWESALTLYKYLGAPGSCITYRVENFLSFSLRSLPMLTNQINILLLGDSHLTQHPMGTRCEAQDKLGSRFLNHVRTSVPL